MIVEYAIAFNTMIWGIFSVALACLIMYFVYRLFRVFYDIEEYLRDYVALHRAELRELAKEGGYGDLKDLRAIIPKHEQSKSLMEKLREKKDTKKTKPKGN